jgi:hypothetical protein
MDKDTEENTKERILVQVDQELEDLVPGYLENRQKDIVSMGEALDHRDYETIRVLGHRMKGSGGGYGFDAISEVGLALQEAASNRNDSDIRKWVRTLAVYLERVEVTYG